MTIIIANWKMYLNLQEADDFCSKLINLTYQNKLIISPPTPYLAYLAYKYHTLTFSAQNVSNIVKNGAYTGEYSASILKSCNINHTIIGHSERKELFNETDELINTKVLNAINSNITPIICIGEQIKATNGIESYSELKLQLTKLIPILESHANKFIIAYEPRWAIGTGIIPTERQLTDVFAFIKALLVECNIAKNVKLVYGGSVNLENINKVLTIKNIDGALIGGSSTNPETLIEIIQRRY